MEKEGLAFSLYAKLERSNPSGSVKDRPAAMIVEDALRKEVLREGGTLVEAFFDASAICLSRSGMLPKRARIAPVPSPDKPDGACVFPSPGCLGMGKGSFGKVVRGFMETRHDRLGREKIVVSGTDGSVRRH